MYLTMFARMFIFVRGGTPVSVVHNIARMLTPCHPNWIIIQKRAANDE